VIADGGCVYPGDVAKAFGAGSDFVMLGGMLAGHEESEVDILDGKMEFYGMSSDRAMEIHGARKDGYRGAEGKDIRIPYKGTVEDTLTEIIGGVRSACTYIGATKIKDMPKCATFVQVLQQENQVFNLF
jgi:GMP reductase